MLSNETLKFLKEDAIRSCELKIEAAKRGHDHIVNLTTICNFKIIEMTSELLNFRKKYGEFEGIKE